MNTLPSHERITGWARRCPRLIAIVILVLAWARNTANAAETALRFGEAGDTCIRSLDDKHTHFRSCDNSGPVIVADARIARILRQSVHAPLLQMNHGRRRYLVLLARTPSTSSGSSRFCGAGSEDQRMLVEHTGKRLEHKDSFLIQSCLKSLALESDQGDLPEQAMIVDRIAGRINFRWLDDQSAGQRTLVIAEGRFHLIEAGSTARP